MGNRERHTNELIHCENCGEDYAATYRCCPFCEERPTRGRGGGTRLKNNTRGGGYGGPPSPLRVLGWVLSLALIIAACVIVFNLLGDLLGFDKGTSDDTTTPSPTVDVTTSPDPTTSPDSTPTPTPASVTSIALNYTDVTLGADETLTLLATVNPSDWGGTVTWTADSSAVTVANGVVTNVNTGSSKVKVTITATAGDKTASCVLYCKPGSSGTTAPAATNSGTAASSPVTLNKTDFTIRTQDPSSIQLKASGGDGSYTWTSSNTSVVTVSADGLVTKVGSGTCTVTCTSGGSSATCTVRVS